MGTSLALDAGAIRVGIDVEALCDLHFKREFRERVTNVAIVEHVSLERTLEAVAKGLEVRMFSIWKFHRGTCCQCYPPPSLVLVFMNVRNQNATNSGVLGILP